MLCESNVVIGMNSAPGQTPIVYVVLPLMTLHRSEQKKQTQMWRTFTKIMRIL